MIKRLMRWIMNLPLKRKILGIVIVVNVFLLSAAAVLGMRIVVRSNEKLLGQAMGNSLSYSASKLKTTLDTAGSLSNIIYSNTVIQDELTVIKSSDDDLARMYAYKRLFTAIQAYYSEYRKNHIRYISLQNGSFTTNSDEYMAGQTPDTVVSILNSRALARDGAMAFETDYCEEYGLFLTRSVRKIAHFSMETLGVLTICLDFNKIVEDSTDFSNAYQDTYYILMNHGEGIYRSPALSAEVANDIQGQLSAAYGIVMLDGHRYFAVKGSVKRYGWDYICLVSYDSSYRQIVLSYWSFVGLIALAMIIAIILSNWLIKSVSGHFNALIIKMKSFRGNTAEVPGPVYDYSRRTDEIGLLHQQFDGMAKEITTLIQENYMQELLAKDAQLQALEMQINPHFLYNILESVNWRARNIGAKDISTMVEALGKLLRITLDKSRKVLPLSEELDLVHHYVAIQRIRFEDQLDYTESVDPETLHAAIPKMVIQPLVENAVRYAVESSLETCIISVTVSKADTDLQIDVANSGSQFEEGLMDKLCREEILPHGFGIGLMNIQDRLRLTFGEMYGLSLFNRNGNAVVRITVPFRPYQE